MKSLYILLFSVTPDLTDYRSDLGLCGPRDAFIVWTSAWALHLSSDVFIFVLPFFILRILQLDWKKMVPLYVTFGFGIFSIGACLARFLIVLLTYPYVPTTTIELWCALDIYSGFMVACLPSLRPYLNLKQEPPQPIVLNSCSQGRSVIDTFSRPTDSLSVASEIYSQERCER